MSVHNSTKGNAVRLLYGRFGMTADDNLSRMITDL